MSALNIAMYAIVGLLMLLTLIKSKEKTKRALKEAWKSFTAWHPDFSS